MKNWVYYMQRGLQSMWKRKSIPDLGNIIKDEIIYSESKKKHEKKVFAEALETIDYQECGCLPDCGCKE